MTNSDTSEASSAAQCFAVEMGCTRSDASLLIERMGSVERARSVLIAARQINVSPFVLAEKELANATAPPDAPADGSDGNEVERVLQVLRQNVEHERSALRRQHEKHMRAQEEGLGDADAYEPGTRLAGERIRLALAELRGAEAMLEAVAKGTAADVAHDRVDGGLRSPDAIARATYLAARPHSIDRADVADAVRDRDKEIAVALDACGTPTDVDAIVKALRGGARKDSERTTP